MKPVPPEFIPALASSALLEVGNALNDLFGNPGYADTLSLFGVGTPRIERRINGKGGSFQRRSNAYFLPMRVAR